MKNIYCGICGTYIKFKNPKVTYISEETLVFSIICSKCGVKDEKIFKDKEQLRHQKVFI